MEIKELFDKAENGTLTYAQFSEAAKSGGAKFTDLSEGNYVSKKKYDDDLGAKDVQIETLNTTISTRDQDLETIKKQLSDAGVDQIKLNDLSSQLETLQGKYDTDTKAFQEKLSRQAYEFAVKEFANTKQFTSNAAKRDFIKSMIDKNLTMNDNKILGAEDFVSAYSVENSDAFVVKKNDDPEPAPDPKPKFSNPIGDPKPGDDKNAFQFNFTGVRPRETN